MRSIKFILVLICLCAHALAQDWLIDHTPYKAGVYTDDKNRIQLSNGLVSRTFKISPNCATISFKNLSANTSFLRGVKPEAEVVINGVPFDVGGLKGQPNYAFLRPQWIHGLKSNPAAFQYEGYEIGKPRERFPWKRVRHHDTSLNWPPKGVYLRMDYRMPDQAVPKGSLPSGEGRRLLASDDFSSLSKTWKVHVSSAHPRSSFENEGKVGEIYTPANSCVFVERSLPKGTCLVEVKIDAGTDQSASWGPGIALVWADRVVKFHLRPGESRFGLWDGKKENLISQNLDFSKPWRLRLSIQGNTLFCDAKPEGGFWSNQGKVEINGQPHAVRIGKLSKDGGHGDFSDKGDLERLRILDFKAYGEYQPPQTERFKVRISVHYELYDGIPCMSKWITIHNQSDKTVTVNRFTSEVLAAVEHTSRVETRPDVYYPTPNMLVETDYAFQGMDPETTSKFSVHWETDPDYSSQVSYLRTTPCLLKVKPGVGPEQDLKPGETFESFRAFITLFDSTDRERQGLTRRRIYRVIAPWTTENPLMMHARFADWERVKLAIDQCAEVGFEMVILTFGSGFNIENESPEYLEKMKKYADYARSKGLEIGGYSLLSSRRIGNGNDIVSPKGQRPTHGNCPALTSEWGQDYFRKLYQFYEKTGHMLLEHDGSYPGDIDVTPRPPLQKGELDSRWVQWRIITDFYKWCRGQGIYLNVPDYYYLAGSNKSGMGYREVNWSLPRAEQVFHTRQNIFDGTWTKNGSMGWMFVPLTQYHGGGAAATIEPLCEHIDHYKMMMLSNLGAGVQACYRGPRLYDTEATKKMVKEQVAWFKKHRRVLEGDLIHLRRADGCEPDYWLMVNPGAKEKGMLLVFNPLNRKVDLTLELPLYYTGLKDKALVRDEQGRTQEFKLSRDYKITLPLTLPGQGAAWRVIE